MKGNNETENKSNDIRNVVQVQRLRCHRIRQQLSEIS